MLLIMIDALFNKENYSQRMTVRKSLYLAMVLAILIGAMYLLLFGGNLSLSKRMDLSYNERTLAFVYGFQELLKNPFFGTGFMKDFSNVTSIQVGIALIASIGNIGLVGFLLFLCIYLAALLRADDKRKFILCNTSFFITTLFAQPFYTSAIIYIFLFDNYKKEKNNCISK